MALDLAKFLLGAFMLWFCANWIVDSAAALARRWGVSELAIGLTVVAVGTSAPEFVVTLNAAFKGLGDISLSNVVGSNIFNLGFILGTMAMIRPLATHRTLVLRDGALLLAVTGFILVSALTTGLSRATGIVLVLFLAGYVLWLMSRPRVVGRASGPGLSRAARWWDWPRLLLAFAGLALGGELVVGAAVGLAQDLGLSRWAIGVTMVAAGTSLPELVTCLAAALKGRSDMLLGNLIGSDLFNFAGVLGLTCLLRPLGAIPDAVPSLCALVAMIGLALVLMRTGWRLSRIEGAFLVLVNSIRWVADLWV